MNKINKSDKNATDMGNGKGVDVLAKSGMRLIDACEKAMGIIMQASEMERLYRRAVRCVGEGQLRINIMNMATDAIEDEFLREEVFVSDESVLSFFCGIWIQFLLVDIAGMKKEKLASVAREVLADNIGSKCIH
jgi:hypothetical protein